MFLMNMDSFYNERMYFSKENQKWIFRSIIFPFLQRRLPEFYATHFIAPNAEDRIEIGDYEKNASGAGTAAVVLIRKLCSAACMQRGRRQALSIIWSAMSLMRENGWWRGGQNEQR